MNYICLGRAYYQHKELIIMNMPENCPDVLSDDILEYSCTRKEDQDTEEYLGLTSNGMTDNEKIDEYDYYEHYLEE